MFKEAEIVQDKEGNKVFRVIESKAPPGKPPNISIALVPVDRAQEVQDVHSSLRELLLNEVTEISVDPKSVDESKAMWLQVMRATNQIASKTRRGMGNHIYANRDIRVPGMLDERVNMVIDDQLPDNVVIVGYLGNNSYDAAAFSVDGKLYLQDNWRDYYKVIKFERNQDDA